MRSLAAEDGQNRIFFYGDEVPFFGAKGGHPGKNQDFEPRGIVEVPVDRQRRSVVLGLSGKKRVQNLEFY
jgi:hypothetical protein